MLLKENSIVALLYSWVVKKRCLRVYGLNENVFKLQDLCQNREKMYNSEE
jgi:hypothetical protein